MNIEKVNDPDFFNEPSLVSLFQNFSFRYPDFEGWIEKVKSQIESGKRIVYVAKQDDDVVGIIIIKNSLYEAKICSLYVSPDSQSRGIGGQLLSLAKGILKGRMVYVHMNENTMYSYGDFFIKHGFSVLSIDESKYKKKEREYNLFSHF